MAFNQSVQHLNRKKSWPSVKQEGTCSCPDCFFEDLSFACLALKLKHQFFSQGPAIFWAEIYAISSSDIRPVDSDWSYTIGSPGSPACRLQFMELLSLPNHMSQFLLRNLSVYTYPVGLFLWRTLTNTPLHIPISNSPLTYSITLTIFQRQIRIQLPETQGPVSLH